MTDKTEKKIITHLAQKPLTMHELKTLTGLTRQHLYYYLRKINARPAGLVPNPIQYGPKLVQSWTLS
jgi:predicted DNA-binding transcriptional regulator AlpA